MSRSPTPDPEPTTLDEAIETSHPERLAETLIAVCKENAEAKKLVESLLLSDIKPDAVKDETKKESLAGKKRKRWEACEECDEEFDVEDNKEGSCKWHAGDLEIVKDAKVLKDGNVELDDDIEPEELAQEFPEAVRFSCCKKDGNAEPCKSGKHRAISTEKMAKMRMLFAGELDGDDDDDDDA